MKRTVANESGFSLIEIMVAVIVFSIAIVFLYQMLFSGQTTVEYEGERRVALKMAEFKIEELKYAGYGSSGIDADWTSVNLDVGTHPADPTVTLDDRGTETTVDDIQGSLVWAVRETTWSQSGVTTQAKIVEVTLTWPIPWNRDQVRLTTLIGE